MKVLMFGWEFPPHISGGLGTACYGLTRGLLGNDVEVTFVIPKAFGDESADSFKLIGANNTDVNRASFYTDMLAGKFVGYGINSLIVPYMDAEEFTRYSEEADYQGTTRTDNFKTTRYEFTGLYGRNLMTEVWNYAAVAGQIAAETNFDVIHAHDWLSFPAGIVVKELSGKPLIAHVHATEFDQSGEHINQQVYEIEKEGMEAADKIIAVSDYTKQLIVNRYNIPAEKIAVVHNAIDQTEKNTPNATKAVKEKIVSYIGRVTYQKGPDYFVQAAKKVLDRDKNYRFVMAGNGDMLNRIVKMAAEYRISSHFHFTGFLKGDEVNQLLQMSSVYVMPSVSEPFGISPLEAVRSNVPVIISRQSGVNEVLKNAFAIDFWDTDAMANAIYALTRYKGLANLFARESQREVKNLKWENQAGKVKMIYQQLLK